METGLDGERVEAFKKWWVGVTNDHVKLRFVLCLAIFLVSYFLLIDPLASRVARGRAAKAKAVSRESMADDLVHFTQQFDVIEPRLTANEEGVDWQNYVLELLEDTGASLYAFEAMKTESRDGFKVVEMEVLVKSPEYAVLVDFVDRLEHGERLVRLEGVVVERQPQSLMLTVGLRGLVKPSRKSSSKSRRVAEEEEAPRSRRSRATSMESAGDREAAGEVEPAGDDVEGAKTSLTTMPVDAELLPPASAGSAAGRPGEGDR